MKNVSIGKRTFLAILLCAGMAAGLKAADNGQLYKTGKLPSSLVNCSVQDSYGYIWTATDYGLSMFDGYRFTHFHHHRNDTTSIGDDITCRLLVDSKQRLWVGTASGASRYDYSTGHFINYRFKYPGNIRPRVYSFVEMSNGDILAGTSGYGVFKLDEKNHTFAPHQLYSKRPAETYCREMLEDERGDLWCLGHDNIFTRYRIAGGKVQVKDFTSPFGAPVKFIRYDKQRMLIACQDGFLFYDYGTEKISDAQFEMKVYNGKATVNCAMVDHEGNLIVGTMGNGLLRNWNGDKHLVQLGNEHADGFSLVTTYINDIMEDRSHNIWVSCYKKGLYLINQRTPSFNTWSISRQNHAIGSGVSSIIIANNDELLCAVPNDGVYRFNHWGGIKGHPQTPAGTFFIYRDKQGSTWLSTKSTLYAYEPASSTAVKKLDIPGGFIYCLADDGKGKVFVSDYSRGIYIYDKATGEAKPITTAHTYGRGRLTNAWVRSMMCDSKGLLWIGTADGLNCMDPATLDFEPLGHHDWLQRHQINALCEDADGNIVVGTEEGLYLLNRAEKSLAPFPHSEDLNDKLICAIVCDKKKRLWVSTTMGIWQYAPENQRFTSYINGDGLTTHEYMQGASWYNGDNFIAFGTEDGLTTFNPDHVTTKKQPLGDVYLTNLIVEGANLYPLTNVVSIPFKDNTFTMEFSLLTFKDTDHIRFLYRVNGGEWTATEEGSNGITFHKQDPGKYVIEVIAENNGMTSEKAMKYTIIVEHPWYSTWWAYLAYLLIATAIMFFIYRQVKRKRQQEAEEEKMRFLINATHDIRSPLTLILGPLKKLRQKVGDPEGIQYIDTMDRNAQRLLLLVNQILDERKIDKNQMHLHCRQTDLVAFITGIKALFQFNAEQRGIRYTFEHDMPKLTAWIDRTNFDKVVSNLLANAFKFVKENGEIKITLEETPTHAVIKVSDSGIGFKAGEDTHKLFERFHQGSDHIGGTGLGLNISKAIVEMHGGTIKAYNRTDGHTGACLEVQIPLGNSHLKPEEMEREPVEEQAAKTGENVKANTNIRVMVVDDDHEVTAYIKSELGHWYHIESFQDGKEALDALLKGNYDLVVTDIIMPQMDGITLLKHIKSNTLVSHIPVVLLTSKAEVSDRLEGLREGADAFLAKPFNMEELHVLIDKLIGNVRRLRGKFSGALSQKELRDEVEVKGADEQFMERVMKSVNENLPDSDFNVERLAADTGVSRAQLHRKMKEITGVSPSDFIRNIRLEEAARLIRENKTNLSQVAYAVGFTNQSHFSTIFKRQYGMPPSEYASRNNETNDVKHDESQT